VDSDHGLSLFLYSLCGGHVSSSSPAYRPARALARMPPVPRAGDRNRTSSFAEGLVEHALVARTRCATEESGPAPSPACRPARGACSECSRAHARAHRARRAARDAVLAVMGWLRWGPARQPIQYDGVDPIVPLSNIGSVAFGRQAFSEGLKVLRTPAARRSERLGRRGAGPAGEMTRQTDQ
jgi:hypothetical protein